MLVHNLTLTKKYVLLLADGPDQNGCNLKKLSQLSQVLSLCLRKVLKMIMARFLCKNSFDVLLVVWEYFVA